MSERITRRSFLRSVSLAAGGLAVAPLASVQQRLERRGAAKKVVVVGAGLAGLVAAYELTRAGHDVTVLEARTRPGGRCYTLREPFSDGLYAEAGATWIAGTHDLALGYIKHFGLEVDPYWPEAELGTVKFVRGRRFVVGGAEPELPYRLTPEERALAREHGGLQRRYAAPAIRELGDPASPDWSVAAWKKYDDVSYAEFLRRQGASAEAVSMMTLASLWGDGPETVSALVWLRDSRLLSGMGGAFKVRGGNDLLPRAFALKLQDKIRYGTPVTRVEHDARGIRVRFRQAGTPQALAAEHVVCAVPFSVLRRVEVWPPLSPAKTRAIRELPYFSASRVYLQSRRRFWLEQKLDGFASTDLPINAVWDMTANGAGPRGILHSYIGGPQARAVAAMAEPQRVAFALRHMERVYPGMREHFEGGASKCWDEDPWSRGASSWYRPGQMNELWPHVARAEGRVHFAGDHTSPWIRWQQGALHSGLRVAREINDSEPSIVNRE
ncbi:MAG TPA: FAD-dependent oxidoreductase [Pyrinomonadaceae bacterium]|nr:FAD-dependent oxidoreductase [Pyrinomonadaceae bacterium]